MIIDKNIILERTGSRPILVDVFFRRKDNKKPVVIFCHGYKGFKDWGAWDLVAKRFSEDGYFFVKFNFSHNGGTIEQPIDFPDLEAFGQNNYSKELDDLAFVIDWITSSEHQYHDEVDVDNITLIGHSRGGGIVTIKAEEDSRVSKVVSWAGVSDYKKRFVKEEALKQWRDDGVMHVINGRTKQEMPHYYQFFEDFIKNEERLTIARAAKNLKIPQLIIHGTEDTSVDPNEAQDLYWWNPKSEIFWVQGADHVFGVKHPWDKQEMSKHLDEIVTTTIRFIRNGEVSPNIFSS
ncbi:alpha/beta hydrolase family protein [Sungkyunkwania multivorans]|uniref:Alpha/beta hydrolase family protein n=1 Tax=Sungkyunkwania multivorans TaxID=1173618 RepID=A0ABW3CZQ6_9FLAO